MGSKIRKFQGRVLNVEKTIEKRLDREGTEWQKCVFTVELTGFSKRTPEEAMARDLKGERVKVVRWCAFDWHYKTGARVTLRADETESLLSRTPTESVYW